MRRLLEELKVALPGDKSNSWFNNQCDSRAYKRLCEEFAVSPDTDWREKLDHGCQGLGSYGSYMEPSGKYRMEHQAQGPFCHPKDSIRHKRDISKAWTMFILDKSEGFTKAGVERLNDSIRTYVWTILGAQAQTHSNILKVGTGFDAQKQLMANLEDAIASPVDIPISVDRYQQTLQYVSTPLDYACGRGLYLMPNDMALHLGNVQGYNNQIQIAGSDAVIGHNPGINETEPINPASEVDRTFQGKTASPAGNDPRELAGPTPEGSPTSSAVAPPADWKSGLDHEEDEAALIVAGIALGLVALWFYTE